jgi:hypothetical protein
MPTRSALFVSVSLTFGSVTFGAATAAADAPRVDPGSPIAVSVKVLSSAKHAREVVPRIIEEANRIWRQYGVCLSQDQASAVPRLRIVIVDDPPSGMFAAGEGSRGLGWITFLEPQKPRNVVYLSWKRAATLLGETITGRVPVEQLPDTLRETYVGRALGRTLAHELGHYLLASTDHARSGLMRPNYPAGQLFEASSSEFLLDAERKKLVAAAFSAAIGTAQD